MPGGGEQDISFHYDDARGGLVQNWSGDDGVMPDSDSERYDTDTPHGRFYHNDEAPIEFD